jgi:hypothetical protein
MPLKPARELTRYATLSASEKHPAYPELSGLMCWSAAIRCALNAGCITPARAQLLEHIDWGEDFSSFVSRSDTRVSNAEEMRQVPEGAFIAFIRVDPPDPYFRFVHDYRGKRHIIHAMISLGDGKAAGNKNSCIGIGRHVGWECLDLAEQLNWFRPEDGRKYDAFDGYPRNVQKTLPLRIRYRELAKFQDGGSQGRRSVATSEIQTLDTGATTVVKRGEIWNVGPLGDCVALAAVKPANSVLKHAAKKIFLWHSDGGLIKKGTVSYKNLRDFLGSENADWIFVHGRGKTGHESFHRQDALAELEDLLNTTSGNYVADYRGSRLLIDSSGRLLNENELVSLWHGQNEFAEDERGNLEKLVGAIP